MSETRHFDYIIIGNGLAGLQLALKISSNTFFDNKQIALIDSDEKKINDKTWSFWTKNTKGWSHIIHKSWDNASIFTSKKTIALNLTPYRYNTIRAIDFYEDAKTKLGKKSNFHFIIDTVESVKETNQVLVTTKKDIYTASHVFDSRIPSEFTSESKHYSTLIQHFKGYIIKTEQDVFKDHTLTMMDYRLKDGNQTTFTYVLPFSKTEALVEFTYFTEHLVDDGTYDTYLKKYIKDYLNLDTYLIIETEKGQIPMTHYPFEKFNTKNITKIGTAGGWVKGSTGYSFSSTERKVNKIVENLKANHLPSKGLFKKRFKFYDAVFLKVLKDENYKGEWIFEQFYSKNTPQTMFRFLDEESTFAEELKIMYSLFSWSFIKAFFKI